MFKRTHQYKFSIPKEHLKYRLVGNHLTVHQRDFEVLEDELLLTVIPNVEEEKSKTPLPITEVELKEQGNKTEMVITSRMRAIEAGAQMVMMLFCTFFVAASFILLYVGNDPTVTIALCVISLLVFLFFFIRLQMGYFDYVRKINSQIKLAGDQITTDVRRQLFKHKMK